MAITFGFYNAVVTNGIPDRSYDAVQISHIMDGVINDGIFSSIGSGLQVLPTTPNSMRVSVGIGRAWFNSTWTLNDAIILLDISPSEVTLKRIDAVVLEVNSSENVRQNTIKVIAGTPSAQPTKPTLTNTDYIHQYALAYITVNPQVDSIVPNDIEDARGRDGGAPYVTAVSESFNVENLIGNWELQWQQYLENVEANIQDYEQEIEQQVDNWYQTMVDSITPDDRTYVNLYNLINSSSSAITLVASNWVNDNGTYKYTISDNRITTTSNQEVMEAVGNNEQQHEAWQEADIADGGQNAGSLTLIARGDVPLVNIPIRIIFRGIK